MSPESVFAVLSALAGALSLLIMFVVMPKVDNACELPMPPMPSYWLGHAWQFLDVKRLLRTNLAWFRELGDVFQIWVVHRQVVVTANPDDVVHILGKPALFERPPAQTALFNDLQPDSFQTMSRDLHSLYRKRIRSILNPASVREFAATVSNAANTLVRRMGSQGEAAPGEPINFTPEIADITFGILLDALLGTAMNAQKRKEFAEASHALLRELLIEYFTYPLRRVFAFTGVRRGLFRRHRHVMSFAEEILKERENESTSDRAVRSSDVLDVIREMDATDRRRQLSNVCLFAIAGFESSSEAIAWAIYEICGRPDIQRQIQKEITTVFGVSKELAYDDVMKLYCLQHAWKETLRMHPAAGFVLRVATRDEVLPGSRVHIPAGVQVGVLVAGAQRNPRYVSAPDEFRPERWAAGAKDRPRSSAFAPYSCGPERCPGQALADFEALTILAALFRDFDVELSCARDEIISISDWTERARSAAPRAPKGDISWTIPVLLKPRAH